MTIRGPQRALARLRMLCLASVLAGCTGMSQQDMQTAQTLEDVGVAFAEIQANLGEMHDRIDSLATVVVQQDSLIRTLANLAGVQVR